MEFPVYFDQEILDPNKTNDWNNIKKSNFNGLVKQSIRNLFPEVSGRSNKRKLYKIVSSSAEYQIRNIVNNDLSIIGSKQNIWVLADDDVDMLIKGNINRNLPENERRIDDQELMWIEYLESENLIKKVFNKTLFTSGDSSESEQSGILVALLGSFYALLITLVLSFPIGIATAVYLEEFAPKDNKFVDHKLNHTCIGTSIVPTQPLGFNFLGGKLVAMLLTNESLRQHWKKTYGDVH